MNILCTYTRRVINDLGMCNKWYLLFSTDIYSQNQTLIHISEYSECLIYFQFFKLCKGIKSAKHGTKAQLSRYTHVPSNNSLLNKAVRSITCDYRTLFMHTAQQCLIHGGTFFKK